MSQLGRFIEQRRTELGMSRRDLAERSGLSYPYVSQLETGEREPALKAMKQLAPALAVPVEELASMVAGGDWAGSTFDSFSAAAPRAAMAAVSAASPRPHSDKILLSMERRLR